SYFVSYSNRLEEGIVRNNDMERHSFLAKFNTQMSERLEIGASMNYVNTDIIAATEGNGVQSYLWTVYAAPITYNLQGDNPQDYLNSDGTQRLYRTNRNNPYFLVDNNQLSSDVNRFLPSLNISFQLADGLKLINRTGADIYSDRRLYREVIGTLGTYPSGRVYEDNINYRQINNDLVLQYNRRFEHFDLDFIVGNQINDLASDRIYTQGVTLSVPDFFDLSNASTITTSQNNSQRRLIGLYGSASIGYKSFLYLTVTGRNDWASTLPKSNRSYFYPSVSGSFVVTDAFPSLNNSVLSFLKLRLGYAQVGNDAPVYATQTDLYVQSNVGDGQRGEILFPYNGQNGFTISNIIGNPELKPERTQELEAGLEMYLFQDRVRLEGSYYDRLSKDQIFQAPVAASSGAVSRLVNAGSMRNKGVELLLEFTPIKTNFFQWDLGGTFTKNVNTVEELTDGVDNIRLGGFTSPGIYIVRNQGYGVIWGSRYERNDDGQVIIDDDPNSATYGLPLRVSPSLGVIGSTLPDWFAGVRTTLTFGNENTGRLSLFGLLDIRQGGDIMNLDNFYLNFYGVTEATEDRTGENTFVYPNSVLPDGSDNNIEVPYDETYWRVNYGRADEDLVEDGSFVRLREVTMRYSLPQRWLANTFISDLNVAITGRNLFLSAPNFSGADPESSLYGSANGQGFYNFITPGTKGYNFALNVTF
ncbi:MAG: TonB-dependent receptor, partial [Lewinella sp.]|nr:TonB-dependent receptor [Lewinella sp.]